MLIIKNLAINLIDDSFALAQEIRKIIYDAIIAKQLKSNIDNRKTYSHIEHVEEIISSSLIEIMEVISWVEDNQKLDSNFPLKLPEEFIEYHKHKAVCWKES